MLLMSGGRVQYLFLVNTVRILHDQLGSVPYFIYKMPVTLNTVLRKLDVPAHGCESRKGKTERVSTVLVNNNKRIDDISPGFTHFMAIGVSDKGMYINFFKRYVPHKLYPHHYHARYPEKEDVKPGHQAACGVEFF